MAKPTCSINGCDRPARSRGWCQPHYLLWYRRGSATNPRPDRRSPFTEAERFWIKVDKNGPVPDYAPQLGPCWIWTAGISDTGYGLFTRSGAHVPSGAHVVAYEWANGLVPDGCELDHLCRARACVRPSHLEAVTHLENVRRGEIAMRTHCPQGHPYDETNTYVWRGGRYCRPCQRLATIRWRARQV